MAERDTVCFPRWGTQDVTKHGDDDFPKELNRWYSAEESKALEALIALKVKLRASSIDDFWTLAVEGLAKVVDSQMAFVMKRVLVDDQDMAVEMPPLGEPGSCLMAAALHYCTSEGEKRTIKQNKFHAYACPCAYMRHDKIFVIPEELDGFITNNPNQLPIEVDAYMAIPLFAEDKCIAHFGVMWSKESSPKRRFSWAFVETLMHALEDMIGQRIVEGGNFLKPAPAEAEPQPQRVIPHDAISVAQSLRPYAGSLSHELRTPMQGVVGMLDVMYATVQEAVQSQDDPHLRMVFQNLKESIEVVQDSSRRAVVAADNVVHAYDMNMSVPESMSPPDERVDPLSTYGQRHDREPRIVVPGQDLPLARASLKRRREADEVDEPRASTPNKAARLEAVALSWSKGPEASQEMKAGLQEAESIHPEDRDLRQAQSQTHHTPEPNEPRSSSGVHTHVVRRAANVRAVLQYVINEGLKTGGRPDFVSANPTDDGEVLEIRSRGSDGTLGQKTIRWSVDEALPTTLNYDEKDFSKLVSCVVLNAIKFTDGVNGYIDVQARLGTRGRYVSIRISDNGPGMPADFLPKLFKPFSQENGSLTRHSDGLGLGLMVAKGISRKLGGDLTCVRAEIEPPNNGCEFEIRLPLTPGEPISRPASPSGSPSAQKSAVDRRHSSPEPSKLPSPPRSNAIGLRRENTDPTRAEIMSNINHINNMPNGNFEKAQAASRPNMQKLHRSNALIRTSSSFEIDRELSARYPLTFLVAEDNRINRKLLVSMLGKFGYRDILEAYDGAEAVRQMSSHDGKIDVILMDLWMPTMDGYEATERILNMDSQGASIKPTVLAVTADVTDGAVERAAQVGMKGFMTKPYKLQDLQRLIVEYCSQRSDEHEAADDISAIMRAHTTVTA